MPLVFVVRDWTLSLPPRPSSTGDATRRVSKRKPYGRAPYRSVMPAASCSATATLQPPIGSSLTSETKVPGEKKMTKSRSVTSGMQDLLRARVQPRPAFAERQRPPPSRVQPHHLG